MLTKRTVVKCVQRSGQALVQACYIESIIFLRSLEYNPDFREIHLEVLERMPTSISNDDIYCAVNYVIIFILWSWRFLFSFINTESYSYKL